MTDYLEAAAGENADVLLAAERRLAAALAGLGRRMAGENGRAAEETDVFSLDASADQSELPDGDEGLAPVLRPEAWGELLLDTRSEAQAAPPSGKARTLRETRGAAEALTAEDVRTVGETPGAEEIPAVEEASAARETRPAEETRTPEETGRREAARAAGEASAAAETSASETEPSEKAARAARMPGEYQELPLAEELERLEAALAGGLHETAAEPSYADARRNRTPGRTGGAWPGGHGGGSGAAGSGFAGGDRAYPLSGFANDAAGVQWAGRFPQAEEAVPMEQLDQRLRRDSRRYDGGFFLY